MTEHELIDLLTPTRFRRWLEAQPAGAGVGQRNLGQRCPASNWLRHEAGDAAWPCVLGLSVTAAGAHVPAPNWLYRFICEVDTQGDDEEIVTREQALVNLDTATRLPKPASPLAAPVTV